MPYKPTFSTLKMSKKMCPKKNFSQKITDNSPLFTTRSGVHSAIQFEVPVYKENKAGSYIEFRAYDPEIGKMRRKVIKLNHIKGVTNRRTHARKVIKRLTDQLNNGWNPWIAMDAEETTDVRAHSKNQKNKNRIPEILNS